MGANFGRIYFTIVLLVCFSASACQSAAEREASQIAADRTASNELMRINALLSSNRPVTSIDLDSITKLRAEYPNASVVRVLLQGVLIKREDWAAAEGIVVQTPENERTNPDRINLARIYFKQGKFLDAAGVLKTIRPDAIEGVEAAALLGQSQFYSGDLDEAAITLESIRNELVAQKRSDDLSLLGTIYFRRGDHAKAIETLQKAVEISPENISANSALSRAYAASGDDSRAEVYRRKLQSINIRVAAEEKRKSRVVPLFYKLEDAYAAKDFDKVIALVEQIQPDADDATKPTLYQYLAAAYQAQGKQAEATNALAEAAKITQK